jgi:hypothetical protein
MKDLEKSRTEHMHLFNAYKREGMKSTNIKGKKDMGIEASMNEEMYGKYPASQLVSPIASVHSHHS